MNSLSVMERVSYMNARSSVATVRAHTIAIAMLVAVAAGGSSCQSDDVPREPTARTHAATPAATSATEIAPKYRDAAATLQRDGTAEEAKIALVQELTVDESPDATSVLLGGTENPSILVSMASIKGLSGRRCDVIVPALHRLLDDHEWQRRAWAAKVLGDTRCTDALRKLTDCLQHEHDERVRQRLEAAIKALNEENKG